MPNVVALRKVAAELAEYWSPRIVGEVDDSYVKVAKVKGGLTWHRHDGEGRAIPGVTRTFAH